jgi:hypothetical protein
VIRRIEWRETSYDGYDPMGRLSSMRLSWEVRWFGETAMESGAMEFASLDDSLAKIGELRPSNDYRLEGTVELGWFTMRFAAEQ